MNKYIGINKEPKLHYWIARIFSIIDGLIVVLSLGLLYSNLQIWWVKKRIKLGL